MEIQGKIKNISKEWEFKNVVHFFIVLDSVVDYVFFAWGGYKSVQNTLCINFDKLENLKNWQKVRIDGILPMYDKRITAESITLLAE